MTHSRAALSTWHILSVEKILLERPTSITQEQLGFFEAFLNAFLLFDKISLPIEFQKSELFIALDPDNSIFIFNNYFEPRQSNNSTQDPLFSNIKISLDFKNQDDLSKYNETVWSEQFKHLHKQINPEILIHEYYYLQKLALENNAAMMNTFSTLQIHPLNTMDLKNFTEHLKSKSFTVATDVKSKDFLGLFPIEIPTDSGTLEIEIPSCLTAFTSYFSSGDRVEAALKLRSQYLTYRNEFRKIWPVLEDSDILDRPEQIRKAKESWDTFFAYNSDTGATSSIKFHITPGVVANLSRNFDQSQFFKTDVRNRYHSIKMVSSKDYLLAATDSKILQDLKIQEFVPYDPKNIPRHSNKLVDARKVFNPSIATLISSVAVPLVQFRPTDLDSKEIETHCKENAYYLYLICSRPKITVEEIINEPGRTGINFKFEIPGQKKNKMSWFDSDENIEFSQPVYPFTNIEFSINKEKTVTEVASLIFQKANFDIIDTKDFPFEASEEESELFSPTDLKVEYVGQSYSENPERNILDRLKKHETLQKVISYVHANEPHKEIWILLVKLSDLNILNQVVHGPDAHEREGEHILNQVQSPPVILLETQINFTEACLINYFKPLYNEKFKEQFPSKNHKSYEECYSNLADFYALELQLADLGCRLYSDSVSSKFFHTKLLQFNPFKDKDKFFPGL